MYKSENIAGLNLTLMYCRKNKPSFKILHKLN